MKLLGTGVDLVENGRLKRSVDQFGRKFLDRVFVASEIAYCEGMRDPVPHFAVRFAAKEAVSKAFGTGIGEQINWTDIEIRRKASGEPFVVLHGNGRDLAKRRGVDEIHLSLSHTETYSVAFATLVGN